MNFPKMKFSKATLAHIERQAKEDQRKAADMTRALKLALKPDPVNTKGNHNRYALRVRF